jgi:hypothetical protein
MPCAAAAFWSVTTQSVMPGVGAIGQRPGSVRIISRQSFGVAVGPETCANGRFVLTFAGGAACIAKLGIGLKCATGAAEMHPAITGRTFR